jgi:hypothetical protein
MSTQPKAENTPEHRAETNAKLRTLSHDLSNSMETILQAAYLLGQAKLDGGSKKWVELIDKAGRDCVKINREIREILRAGL